MFGVKILYIVTLVKECKNPNRHVFSSKAETKTLILTRPTGMANKRRAGQLDYQDRLNYGRVLPCMVF